MPCPELPQRAPLGQGHSGPHKQHCDHCIYQPAYRFTLPLHVATRSLLLWSQKHLRSLHAIHIPGVFNRAADKLSRAALPGEWRLHPKAVQLIWRQFGVAQVDLFASPETTHCQWFYSLVEATLSRDALAHSCYGGQQKGKAVSKQSMAHWIVDAITLAYGAYGAQGVPCPYRLRAHSTRGVASSWALARGASQADICRAAGWCLLGSIACVSKAASFSSCVLTSNW